ncbi:DUF4760 domain-containing protein [Acinetobacter sp. YH12239]|uniref:DUF4760 domain-containing protein n=1 Tax=Acinetobacter sp. YH12239 TaxID=2601166 RepID=UPI0015D465EC|nr:DUF4760 domain-containing protein [Acinetobacter sp. YH12239]
MNIDDILILRTTFLLAPYIIISYVFYKFIRDDFFMKPRTNVQLNYSMCCLVISFIWIVLWNISLHKFSFLGFTINHGQSSAGQTILILLGILGAVYGWLFTTKSQYINSRKNHSIQTLMSSRLSTSYVEKFDLLNEILLEQKHVPLSYETFENLSPEQKMAVMYALNYYEYVAVGIRFGDLDEHLIKNTLLSNILGTYTFLENVINYKSQNAPTCLEHLKALRVRWKGDKKFKIFNF